MTSEPVAAQPPIGPATSRHTDDQPLANTAVEASWERFTWRVHATLDASAVAAEIANEGRRLLGCDRLSVVAMRRRRMLVLAVSGCDTFDPRATTIALVEQLAEAVAGGREPLEPDADRAALPPQIAGPLERLCDETHALRVAVWLLIEDSPTSATTPPVLGALVLEWFDSGTLTPGATVREIVCRHSRTALANATTHQRVPWLGAWRAIERSALWARASAWPVGAWIAAALVAFVLILWLVPAPLRVSAPGKLQPAVRREVFARAAGVVDQVLVESGQHVSQGQVLATLHSPELEFEARRVEGEINTIEKQLAAIRSTRLSATPDSPGAVERFNQIAAEEERLKSELRGHEQVLQLVRARQEELKVTAPMAGVVLTWNPKTLLDARPVERGQALLRVAQLNGPWELELEVPQRQSGHLFAALPDGGKPLPVSFVVATRPEHEHAATLRRVAWATTTDEDAAPTVLASAEVDPEVTRQLRVDPSAPLRPGATVRARIDCGTRSLGYVWFHDLLQTLRWWLWL